MLPRLEALVDHISNVASYDTAWDIRDTARTLQQVKSAAKAALGTGTDAPTPKEGSLEALGLWYCRACISGKSITEGGDDVVDVARGAGSKADGASGPFESTWILGSLAQALEFPLDTYRPLPGWAQENSSDDLRNVKVEPVTAAKGPQSISSSNVGSVQHMEIRVQNPSNISNLPVVSSLEDLDLFYREESSVAAVGAKVGSTGGAARVVESMAPEATLEQMHIGGGVGPVGTAVFGEDSESDEEEPGSDDDADWKYCLQASQPAVVAAAVHVDYVQLAPEVTEQASAAAARQQPPFQPPPRVEAESPADPELAS